MNFYVCPVYNQAIKDKKNIKIKEIEKMWDLGLLKILKHFYNSMITSKNKIHLI